MNRKPRGRTRMIAPPASILMPKGRTRRGRYSRLAASPGHGRASPRALKVLAALLTLAIAIVLALIWR